MNKSFFLCFFISITRSTCKYRQKTIFIIAAIVTFQHGIRSYNTIHFFFFFTCEESEGWLRLWSHNFYHAEEGESDSVVGPGKGLCISAHPRFCVSVLCTRESQHGEVSGPESPVQLLQVSVVLFSLFTVTRHVYNQRHLKPQHMVIQQCYNTVLLNSGSWLVRRCWSVFYNRSSDEIWWGNDCL